MSEAEKTSDQKNSISSPSSGFKLRCTLRGHSDIITQIAWATDGKRLASASKDHTIRVWDTETRELVAVLEGHTDTILGIDWTPNEETLISTSDDGTIKTWDTNTGDLLCAAENKASNAISWHPSGKMFTSASRDEHYFENQEIQFWDAQTQKKISGSKNRLRFFYAKIEAASERIKNVFKQIDEFDSIPVGAKIVAGSGKNIVISGSGSVSVSVSGSVNSFIISDDHTFQLDSGNFSYKRQSFSGLLDELLERKSLSKLAWDQSGQILALLNKKLTQIRLYSISAAKQEYRKQVEKLQQLEREWNEISTTLTDVKGVESIEAEIAELRELNAELAERSELQMVDSYVQETPYESIDLERSKFLAIAWSPDSQMLASAVLNGEIMLWDTATGALTRTLEGHADAVTDVSFSFDGRFLASRSLDGSVRLWNCQTWETVEIIYEPASSKWLSSTAFSPRLPTLAILGEKDTVIHIWELDFAALSAASPITSSVHYANAKVVLVGDSGVGKSDLVWF